MPATKQWQLASRPVGEPTHDNFELVTVDRPEPGHGEVLVETLYQSVDPYMRGRMRDAESYADPWNVGEPMKAGIVGEVLESNADDIAAGDIVTGDGLWAEHAAIDADDLRTVDPELGPVSTALGVLGMPGATAYFGLLEVGQPKPGDTVVVSAAAGAVGSVVGQLARINGARVVGTAGSDEKIDWLTDDLGFDAAINYKETDDLGSAVAEACPGGVDVYFDNVGGEITDAVWPLLNEHARVPVCGQIALYNATELPTGPRKLTKLIETRARVEGILVRDYVGRWGEAFERLSRFIQNDELHYRENVVEGLENAPDAFLGLFEGDNIGKQLVKVGDHEY
ncbi:NADP-dependent oxidoreductase [Salinadaptatus halalkaliphilus]|uniref:NADP-dependent oxidoreductase n=1 Tax=Salinadaptatus halalkaliphilus TaxID=2419781 RepID=A0A4S3TKJ9_9EURY|nr:NADP-dependent oxidoreductase [Salinadaptatus halalkaliphilus]THE64662.1 NADP-dependent oxidoreductase [Salinadaptatus halalkaliphilus]